MTFFSRSDVISSIKISQLLHTLRTRANDTCNAAGQAHCPAALVIIQVRSSGSTTGDAGASTGAAGKTSTSYFAGILTAPSNRMTSPLR